MEAAPRLLGEGSLLAMEDAIRIVFHDLLQAQVELSWCHQPRQRFGVENLLLLFGPFFGRGFRSVAVTLKTQNPIVFAATVLSRIGLEVGEKSIYVF